MVAPAVDYVEYPLSIRDVSPGAGAKRIYGQRANGSLDGQHTGGVWYYEDRFWKPLDGRPYANAECHISTREDEVLTEMQDTYGFPKNWEVIEQNGRRWLVRERVWVIPSANRADLIPTKFYLDLEEGLRTLNRRGWEVNDDLVLAIDRQDRLMILDLSAASRIRPVWQANDYWQMEKWWETNHLLPGVIEIRRAAQKEVASLRWKVAHPGYQFVYGSLASDPDLTGLDTIHVPGVSLKLTPIRSWVITQVELDLAQRKAFKLVRGWIPTHPLSE